MAMIAVGYPYRGALDALPEKSKNELAERSRKPRGEVGFAVEGASRTVDSDSG